jgi:hypothetical protein
MEGDERFAMAACRVQPQRPPEFPPRPGTLANTAPRQGSKKSAAARSRTFLVSVYPRSMTRRRSTSAMNVSFGAFATLVPANARRYSSIATRLLSEKCRQFTPAGLQRPGRPDMYRNDGRPPPRTSTAGIQRTRRRCIRRVGTRSNDPATSTSLATSGGTPRQHVFHLVRDHPDLPIPYQFERSSVTELVVREMEPGSKLLSRQRRAQPGHALERPQRWLQ